MIHVSLTATLVGMESRVSWFLMKIFVGSCHSAVVSFWCKTCETDNKNFFNRVHAPCRGRKKAHKRGPTKFVSNPLMMGIKKRNVVPNTSLYFWNLRKILRLLIPINPILWKNHFWAICTAWP
jgi:hypothetical protein